MLGDQENEKSNFIDLWQIIVVGKPPFKGINFILSLWNSYNNLPKDPCTSLIQCSLSYPSLCFLHFSHSMFLPLSSCSVPSPIQSSFNFPHSNKKFPALLSFNVPSLHFLHLVSPPLPLASVSLHHGFGWLKVWQ